MTPNVKKPRVSSETALATLSFLGSVGAFAFSYFEILPYENLYLADPHELWAAYETKISRLYWMLPWPTLGAILALVMASIRQRSRTWLIVLLVVAAFSLTFVTWLGAELVGFDYD